MLIDIEGKVIILDEAHNMEDTAREAASLSLTQIQITDVLEEIRELCMCIYYNYVITIDDVKINLRCLALSVYVYIYMYVCVCVVCCTYVCVL